MTIKLWDWDKKWQCAQTFEGHTHYVMQIVINPKDNNTFASASLDRTIKVGEWFIKCRFMDATRKWPTCGFRFKPQFSLIRLEVSYLCIDRRSCFADGNTLRYLRSYFGGEVVMQKVCALSSNLFSFAKRPKK